MAIVSTNVFFLKKTHTIAIHSAPEFLTNLL